jgi:hypothetical protein
MFEKWLTFLHFCVLCVVPRSFVPCKNDFVLVIDVVWIIVWSVMRSFISKGIYGFFFIVWSVMRSFISKGIYGFFFMCDFIFT